jgi:hypothetical protein
MKTYLVCPAVRFGVLFLLWGIWAGTVHGGVWAAQPGLADGLDRSSHDVGVLIIPDSTNKRLMTFSPVTGDLIDADFITLDDDATGTAIHALRGPEGTILVTDQTQHVVHEYNLAGNYLGVFAPAGGADTDIMENIRGMLFRGSNLLVTVGAGLNAHAIAEFDGSGNFLGNFIANGSGGLSGPFALLERHTVDLLVSSIDTNNVLSFGTSGAPLGEFAPVSSFPQQIASRRNGNVLVANFSGQPGIHEFTADGVPVRVLAPEGLSSYRGVFELFNGNVLVTTSGGVFEIDNQGQLVSTKHTGQSRFIEHVPPTGIWLRATVGQSPDPEDEDQWNNFCPLGNEYHAQPGESVRWCYTVTNNTTTTLTRHDLVSDLHGDLLDGFNFSLDPGQFIYLWQTQDVDEDTIESATWTAYNPGPLDVHQHTASTSVFILGPMIFHDRFESQE